MDLTAEALNILVVLLPGFAASTLLELLLVRKQKDHFSKVIEALVLSFLIYAFIAGVLSVEPYKTTPPDNSINPTFANPTFVLAAAAAALVLPLFLGLLTTNDLHMKVFRWLKITTKTARDTIWLDVFTNHKKYVIVNLTGKRRVFGWPMYYSNTPEEGLLYLYDAAWINEDGTYSELNAHGLFLLEKTAIESIEFLKLGAGNAKAVPQERPAKDKAEKTDARGNAHKTGG